MLPASSVYRTATYTVVSNFLLRPLGMLRSKMSVLLEGVMLSGIRLIGLFVRWIAQSVCML